MCIVRDWISVNCFNDFLFKIILVKPRPKKEAEKTMGDK